MPKTTTTTTTTTPNKTHYDGPRGLFALDLEPVEGRPSLSRVSVTIIDGTACKLIYDAAIRRMANTPTWKQIENMEGLREGLQALLIANGLAVPVCAECMATSRVQNSDKRKHDGCKPYPHREEVQAGCRCVLCEMFQVIPEERKAAEQKERDEEIKADREYEEQRRLEELEEEKKHEEYLRLRRKYRSLETDDNNKNNDGDK